MYLKLPKKNGFLVSSSLLVVIPHQESTTNPDHEYIHVVVYELNCF